MNQFDSAIFLENIEWFDETGEELVHRLPDTGSGEIKWGAQLTVRESQAAVLFYKGKACDAFGPGRYTLKTANLPILTKILSIPWGETVLCGPKYIWPISNILLISSGEPVTRLPFGTVSWGWSVFGLMAFLISRLCSRYFLSTPWWGPWGKSVLTRLGDISNG